MRLNDWDWRREQEEACRFFDFAGLTVIDDKWPRYKDTDKVAEYCDNDVIATKSLFEHFQANYGAKAFENKEDTKMNITQGVRDEQAKNDVRRNIMKKLKVGDKICTSANMTTPMEIFAFDYGHLRIGLTYRISGEGYEKVSRCWVDPLTIINPDVRSKVSYADYYRGRFTRRHIPTPKKIIVNVDSKVTVVMWDDNTKTIVKCSEEDQYDGYAAYCAAFAKKCYGTNSQLKKTIENHTVFQESKKKNKTDAPLLPSMEEAAKSFCDAAKKYFGTD